MPTQGKYNFDYVPVDESRERPNPITEGIPAGTIRTRLPERREIGFCSCSTPKGKLGRSVFLCRDGKTVGYGVCSICGCPIRFNPQFEHMHTFGNQKEAEKDLEEFVPLKYREYCKIGFSDETKLWYWYYQPSLRRM